MPTYRVTYRDEFETLVEAESAESALEKFRAGKVKEIKVVGNLWRDFFEIENVDTEEIVKESGWDITEKKEESKQ